MSYIFIQFTELVFFFYIQNKFTTELKYFVLSITHKLNNK